MPKPVATLTIAADPAAFAERLKAPRGGGKCDAPALAAGVRTLALSLFDAKFLERHLHAESHGDSQVIFVEASLDSFTQAFFDGARDLLEGGQADGRFHVLVQGVPLNGRTTIGSALLEADNVLIDRALYGVLRWKGFDFRAQRVEYAETKT